MKSLAVSPANREMEGIIGEQGIVAYMLWWYAALRFQTAVAAQHVFVVDVFLLPFEHIPLAVAIAACFIPAFVPRS